MRFGIFLIGVLVAGCTRTTDGSAQPDFSHLRARAASEHAEHTGRSHAKKKKARKTSSRRKSSKTDRKKSASGAASGRLGYLTGEGTGSTRHKAVVSAIAAVTAQISASVKANTTTRDYQDDKKTESSVEQRLESQSSFPYAELIKVAEVTKEGRDFRVVAELDKAAAIDAIRAGFKTEKRAFEREVPRIKTAVAQSDYAILLSKRFSPSAFLRKYEHVRRMLSALGHRMPEKNMRSLRALADQVAKKRAKARLRLRTKGDVPAVIRSGSHSVFSEVLTQRGCQLVAGNVAGEDVVDVSLKLVTRDHREFDADWVYLGFELNAVAQTDGQVVLRVNGMPEFVHGGGMKPAQAHQAVIVELAARLKKDQTIFSGLVCGEDF